MTGLSDRAQTILTIIGYTLGSLGGITTAVAAIHNENLIVVAGVVVVILGAISFGIKEGLGIKPTAPAVV